MMIEPAQAVVRPRVFAGAARGIVLVEDLVAEMAESQDVSEILLFAQPAGGVTTALRHLAFCFSGNPDIDLIDLGRPSILFKESPAGRVVLHRQPAGRGPCKILCSLAGWARDEWIEYLLGAHKSKCASVMTRMQHDPATSELGDNPNILSQVLDQLAGDDELPGVNAALSRLVERHFPNIAHRRATGRRILLKLYRRSRPNEDWGSIHNHDQSADQRRLLQVPGVLLNMAAEVAWSWLEEEMQDTVLLEGWKRELITTVATRVATSPPVQARLNELLNRDDHSRHSLAASLLHLANIQWNWSKSDESTDAVCRLDLEEAILNGADCTQMPLIGSDLTRASLVGANLVGADLRGATAKGAFFNAADLQGATLNGFDGTRAQFRGANLSDVYGRKVILNGAELSHASLKEARLDGCSFLRANMIGADLEGASLIKCPFRGSRLAGANFSDADLREADFSKCNLSEATFLHAQFRGAKLSGCDMTGMELPNVNFEGARLQEAYLTGAVMFRANFRKANLRMAKLADVDWECANLQFADLRGATFHMGSSRSGLVQSSIPMEGSRTGFYNDDWRQQDYQSPEEVRKANLRGADLRGAIIAGVDFYLVDLRDALYDDDQVEQLRSTGAILEARIC